jgi:hypothetical protein
MIDRDACKFNDFKDNLTPLHCSNPFLIAIFLMYPVFRTIVCGFIQPQFFYRYKKVAGYSTELSAFAGGRALLGPKPLPSTLP